MLQLSIGVSVLHTATLLLFAADVTHYMTCIAGGLPHSQGTLSEMSASSFIHTKRQRYSQRHILVCLFS